MLAEHWSMCRSLRAGAAADLAAAGQLAFPLRRLAGVGSQPGTGLRAHGPGQGRQAAGAGDIRPVTSDAETLDAEPGSFELAVIGNAFHQLRPRPGRAQVCDWLRPAGAWRCAGRPHRGPARQREWQRALAIACEVADGARGPGTGTACGLGPGRKRRGLIARCCPRPVRDGQAPRVHPVHGGAWRNSRRAHPLDIGAPAPVLGDHGGAFDDDLAASAYSDDGASVTP